LHYNFFGFYFPRPLDFVAPNFVLKNSGDGDGRSAISGRPHLLHLNCQLMSLKTEKCRGHRRRRFRMAKTHSQSNLDRRFPTPIPIQSGEMTMD